MRTLVSLLVLMLILGLSSAYGFEAWEMDRLQPSFQALGGSDTDINPLPHNTAPLDGSSLFEGFPLGSFSTGSSELGGHMFDDWGLFVAPGSAEEPESNTDVSGDYSLFAPYGEPLPGMPSKESLLERGRNMYDTADPASGLIGPVYSLIDNLPPGWVGIPYAVYYDPETDQLVEVW